MKKIFTLILIAAMVFCLMPTASAISVHYKDCETITLPLTKVVAPLSNDFSQKDRPLIIFFPGSGEVNSANSARQFLYNNKIYDKLDINLLIVTFSSKSQDWKHWNDVISKGLLPYLTDINRTYGSFRIILDGSSFGGYGACYAAKVLKENGLNVVELNMADGCVTDAVNADMVKEVLGKGIRVNIFGCNESRNISKNTRAIIESLDGLDNFHGKILKAYHGKVIIAAILQEGLHSEYVLKPPVIKNGTSVFVIEPLLD